MLPSKYHENLQKHISFGFWFCVLLLLAGFGGGGVSPPPPPRMHVYTQTQFVLSVLLPLVE